MKISLILLICFIAKASYGYEMEEMLTYVDPDGDNVQLPLYNPQPPFEDEEDDEFFFGKPAPCCGPNKWEGYAVGHGVVKMANHKHGRPSRPIHFSEFFHLHYDYSGKRFAMSEFVAASNKHRKNFTLIADFKHGKGYYICHISNKCKTYSLKRKTIARDCIPKNTTYLASPVIGAASDSLKLNVFAGKFQTKRMRGCYMITATSRLCIPTNVAVGVKSRRVTGAKGISYYNIRPNIKSAKVFVPPRICKGVEDVDEDDVFENYSDMGQLLHEYYINRF